MRKTVRDIIEAKVQGNRLTMLTAYDATMAALLSQCEVDMLLVGDSLGMVVLGHESTVSVTMDEMVHHARAVRRGAPEAFIVSDMPFGSHQVSIEDAVRNGLRFLKEADSDAVKIEGGSQQVCDTVRRMVAGGIPVMGHIGLTPQTASQLGGYKVQGKDAETAQQLIDNAKSLQEAGVFSVLMECVPKEVAGLISKELKVPTIGIGAGAQCDGQVLVTQDMLGMFEKFTPKFVKQYKKLAVDIKEGVTMYCDDVRAGAFPADEQSFLVDPAVRKKLKI